MDSKELLRLFYITAERLCPSDNDDMLGSLNSAYCQIADDIDLLNTILKYVWVQNGSLVFKNISSKKNKHDFDIISKKARKL